jgi:phosphohistidine phosphatase SixA
MRSNKDPIALSSHWARRLIVAALLFLSLFSLAPLRAADSAAQQPLVVFVVRHAEKADASRDPDLSVAGRQRAAQLAVLLRDTGVKYVHSSDFKRTKDTAAPVAAALGLEVKSYDPQDLPSLVTQLRQTGGRHLIVGHSNTTPETVELLGGDPSSAIDDKSEFDRLYIVNVGADGAVSTVLMRYGAPYSAASSE